jgi:hypothetical protein
MVCLQALPLMMINFVIFITLHTIMCCHYIVKTLEDIPSPNVSLAAFEKVGKELGTIK